MAFRADLEIGVKGISYLDQLQNKLTQISRSIDSLNSKEVVVRRTISGAASTTPLGPGGAGVTRASAVSAATAVERQVRNIRRQETQETLQALKTESFANNYINDLINKRLQVKQKELALEKQRTAEIERQALKEAEQLRLSEQKVRNQRIQNVALGAGFPLLFGGGPGAVLGGAAGGLVGGPGAFAAQIALSAIGQQIDMFVASAAKAGVALTSTGQTLEYMREKSLFSTKAVEDQAIALEKQGRVTELSNLLVQDLATTIGGKGVRALQALGDQTNILTKEWNTLTAQLFALVAGPLSAFIKALNTVLGGITTENRLSALRNEATPAQARRLAQITAEERGGTVRNVRGGGRKFIPGAETTQVRQRILERAAAEGITIRAPEGRVTSEDLRTITPPKPKKDRTVEEAAREAKRVAEVVRDRRASAEFTRIESELQDKIADAELRKDALLATRLRGEQDILNIQYQYAKLLADEQNPLAQAALIYDGITQMVASRRNTERDINKLSVEREQLLKTTLGDLQYELDLKNAATQAERDQLQIAYEMEKLRQSGQFDEGALATIRARKEALAAPLTTEQGAKKIFGQMRDELQELVRIENQVKNGADAIATSFAQAFRNMVSGATSAQQALADMMQSIADRFLDMAAQIIAQQVTMIIFGTVMKALGISTGGGGGGGGGDVVTNFNAGVAQYGFAEGGFVTGPTNAVIGEGGESEYVIPASKMRSAMNRYAAGARGASVIPAGSDGGDGMTATMTAPAAIDVRYTVERINSVDYVTADQFQRGMQRAAAQGAQQGEQRALATLRQNTTQRRRIGL